MSSFPQHKENIETLKDMGYDVEEFLDTDGGVELEGWNYDNLTYLVANLIDHLPDMVRSKDYES